MIYLKIAGIIALMFAGSLLTSFAEYKFNYSLYKTIFRVK